MIEVQKEYAQAIFAVASEEGRVEEFVFQLSQIADLIDQMPEYLSLLSSSAVSLEERKRLIEEAFGSMEESVVSLLKLMTENSSILLLPAVVEEVLAMYRAFLGESEARIVSAVELSPEQKRALQEALEKKIKKKILPVYQVDPQLIGGIKAEVEGVTFDGSVKKRLSDLKDVMIG